MKDMVDGLVRNGLTNQQAKISAKAVVEHITDQIYHGFEVDLGFAVIKPHRVPPRVYRYQLKGEHNKLSGEEKGTNPIYCVGEHYVWKCVLRESWLKRTSPKWSKPV